MNETALLAGFARGKVTPPMGAKIPGYFKTRYSDGIITDLYLQATAFSDGETCAIVFSCDTISIADDAYALISSKISECCGIEPEAVYIHATHSHTAFRIILPPKDDPVYSEFFPFVVSQFCEVSKAAFADLKPCTMKVAFGKAEGISFNRRYEMKDGTYKTNPRTGDPDIARRCGPLDESVQLLRILREGGKEILFVNFGTHPDTVGGTQYCADWCGYLVDFLRGAFNQNVEAMMLNGAQGDVNHCDRFLPAGTVFPKTFIAQKMARVLTGEVLKIYDSAKDIDNGKIFYYREKVVIGKNAYNPAHLPLAREINEHYQVFLKTGIKDDILNDPDLRRLDDEGGRAMSIPEAVRIIANLTPPDTFEFPVSGLQIGPVGFIGIPGEPFTQIGMDTKKDSKLALTIVNCLVNGGRGYFPTEDAFAVGGYERSTSRFASNCAEIVTEACLKIRTKMEEKL